MKAIIKTYSINKDKKMGLPYKTLGIYLGAQINSHQYPEDDDKYFSNVFDYFGAIGLGIIWLYWFLC